MPMPWAAVNERREGSSLHNSMLSFSHSLFSPRSETLRISSTKCLLCRKVCAMKTLWLRFSGAAPLSPHPRRTDAHLPELQPSLSHGQSTCYLSTQALMITDLVSRWVFLLWSLWEELDGLCKSYLTSWVFSLAVGCASSPFLSGSVELSHDCTTSDWLNSPVLFFSPNASSSSAFSAFFPLLISHFLFLSSFCFLCLAFPSPESWGVAQPLERYCAYKSGQGIISKYPILRYFSHAGVSSSLLLVAEYCNRWYLSANYYYLYFISLGPRFSQLDLQRRQSDLIPLCPPLLSEPKGKKKKPINQHLRRQSEAEIVNWMIPHSSTQPIHAVLLPMGGSHWMGWSRS